MKKNILTSLVAVVVAIALVFGMSAFKKVGKTHNAEDYYTFIFTPTTLSDPDGTHYKNLDNWSGDSGMEENPGCSSNDIPCLVQILKSVVDARIVGSNPREKFVNYLQSLSNQGAEDEIELDDAISFKAAP